MAITFLSLALFRRPTTVASRPASATKNAEDAPGQSARSHAKDWTHDRAALLEIGEQMLAQCRHDKLPLSVLVFDQKHLPELSRLFGVKVARQVLAKLTQTLEQVAAPKGLVIRTQVATFTVLLPGVCRDVAQTAVEQALGKSYSIDLDAGDDEIVLAPDFLIQTVSNETSSIQEVCEVMRQDIKRLQEYEQRRKLFSRRQRQSHSSKPVPPVEADDRCTSADRPETVPMPFGPRH
jgi:GGDEF domain-containing protein